MRDLFRLPQPDSYVRYSHVSKGLGTITSHRKLTHDTHEIIISCDDNFHPANAEAGQFAVLGFPGIARPRPYSFARNPRSEPLADLTFFIRSVLNGEVSGWLNARNRIGSKVEIVGPVGKFMLDDQKNPLVCIAGGSGMSAILALIEYSADLQVARDCYFYYGARSQSDLYCLEEIEHVKARWNKSNRFVFVPVLSEEPAMSDWEGRRGFVSDVFSDEMTANVAVNLKSVSSFLCGPPLMIKAAYSILKKSGVLPNNIFQDNFEDARSPAPVIDNHRCVLCDECLLVKPIDKCIVETAGLVNGSQGKQYQMVDPSHTSGLYYNSLYINASECIRCFACVDACPHGAISADYSIGGTLRQKINK